MYLMVDIFGLMDTVIFYFYCTMFTSHQIRNDKDTAEESKAVVLLD